MTERNEVVAALRSTFVFEIIGSSIKCAGNAIAPVALGMALSGEEKEVMRAVIFEHAMSHLSEIMEICEVMDAHGVLIIETTLASMTREERVEIIREAMDDELVQSIIKISEIPVESFDPETVVTRLEEEKNLEMKGFNS